MFAIPLTLAVAHSRVCFCLNRARLQLLQRMSAPRHLPRQHAQHLQRIGIHRAGKVDEFDHVEPAFAAFYLGHPGLRLAETVGDLLLRQTRPFARAHKRLC